MALSKKKPRELSIKEKVIIIQQKESEGKSQRNLLRFSALARLKYRTHLKERQTFLAAYDDNLSNDRKRVRIFQFEGDIDSLTFRWFQRARSLNLPISGPLIQEKALTLLNL